MLLQKLGKEMLFLDGAMGTMLQEKGLLCEELPETINMTHAAEVADIHRQYIEAGSDIILTNTFGANRKKYHSKDYSLRDIIFAAVHNAREGIRLGGRKGKQYYIALDVGPTGRLLKPMGDLSFEEAYETFCEVMRYGKQAGVDLIYIETMSDTYEMKAAVLAAKESTDLPVFATMVFDEHKKTLTGAGLLSAVALLEGLRADAIGVNCGLGPLQMQSLMEELQEYASVPVIIKPNAGLPVQKDDQVCYDVSAAEFAQIMGQMKAMGAAVMGGCCGTTPEHICFLKKQCKGAAAGNRAKKQHTVVTSYGKAVIIGRKPVVIGERINPTGKKRFKQALKDKDMGYILREAISQQEAGAHILDVNVGLPDIDETAVMCEVVQELQSVTSLPLQIDTVDIGAMEAAMRIYNGKPMVNSVNAKQETMDAIFPLIRKYGGVVVGLTIDEDGIPETAKGRQRAAGIIIEEAAKYGIDKKDIVIDVLTMAASAGADAAGVTLEALRLVQQTYDVRCVLGVSNVSFGLPGRPGLNAGFYTLAMQAGLDAGIINPLSEAMMNAYYCYCALMNFDKNCEDYIAYYEKKTKSEPDCTNEKKDVLTLRQAIEKGLKDRLDETVKELIAVSDPLTIINSQLVPALDTVGKGFEQGTLFLPQLLMSAEAAKEAFAILREHMKSAEGEGNIEIRQKVILATVKGDVHDIGKNIVKVLLENYNFDVVDLGKDVAPETIVRTAVDQKVELVGLSALMTTTVASMEETIRLLREEKPGCKVMVGGAVMNPEYAEMIGADFYGKDAMQSVYYAQEILNKQEEKG